MALLLFRVFFSAHFVSSPRSPPHLVAIPISLWPIDSATFCLYRINSAAPIPWSLPRWERSSRQKQNSPFDLFCAQCRARCPLSASHPL